MEITKFCTGCGNGLIETSAICPKCGTPVAGAIIARTSAPKTRNTALLLAVFLGFWTYFYTYAKDKARFWIFLAANLIGYTITIASIKQAISDEIWYTKCILDDGDGWGKEVCHVGSPNYNAVILGAIIQIGLFVFIIVDRVKKTEEYYANYPN